MRDELDRKSSLEWDLITIERIPADERVNECQLYTLKWFDYRRLHPMQATFELIQCYIKAHRIAYARRFDFLEARNLNLTPMEEGNHKLLEFWRARREIDKLGIPYDFWCSQACDLGERCWSHLTRPEDLVNSFVRERVQERWLETLTNQLRFPTHPFYQLRSYVGHPDQDAWQQFAKETLKTTAGTGRIRAILKFQRALGDRSTLRACESLGTL